MGLLLRLPSYNDSLFGDELSTYFIVSGHSLGHVLYLLRDHSIDLNPPLLFALAWTATKLGDHAQLIVLPSLLAGTALIPFTYLLGLRTVGRPAALVGATLTALSPFFIFYSTEARAYAMMALLTVLSALALWQALDRRQVRWWAAYAACSCAALYTSYLSVFPLVALFGWALWDGAEARGALVMANIAAAVGFLPWLPTFIKETHSPGASVPDILTPFTRHNIRVDLERVTIGHPFMPLSAMPGKLAVALVGAGLAVALLSVAVALRSISVQRRRARVATALPRPDRGMVLVVVLALGPPIAVALYSWLGPHTVFNSNTLIFCLPGLALGTGALVTSGPGPARLAASGLVIAGFAIGAAKMLQAGSQRPDYGAAASFIDRSTPPTDPVLDWPAPTPGPLTSLDVALAHVGSRRDKHRVVLRVGYPSLEAILREPPYANVPAPPASAVVAQAEPAAKGGDLLAVVPGDRGALVLFTAGAGLGPRRYRIASIRTFAGFVPVSVAVLRRSG